jgi:hypothetical protein
MVRGVKPLLFEFEIHTGVAVGDEEVVGLLLAVLWTEVDEPASFY